MEITNNKFFQIIKDGKEAKIQMFIVVEMFRLLLWIWFLLTLLIGVLLTIMFTKEDYKAIMEGVFGSVNACVYLDFYPATYVAPVLYAFFPVLVFLYCVASIFRAWISMREDKIDNVFFVVYSLIFTYFFTSTLVFAIVFAIQPDLKNPDTIKVHTFPFTNVIFAIMLLQMMITWFDLKVSWIETTCFKWLTTINLFALFIIILSSTLKILQHLNSVMFIETTLKISENGKALSNGFIWNVHEHEIINWVFQLTDITWVFTVVLLPIVQGGYLLYRSMDTHGLIITIEDNRTCKAEYHYIE